MRTLLLFLVGFLGHCALAQAQQRDPAFHNAAFRSGANAATLTAVTRQADGKYLVLGDFTTVDGHPTRNVARLLPDGNPDVSFSSPRAYGRVVSDQLAVQPDGRVLIWADSAQAIVRLLPNGAPDASFLLDTSATLGVRLRRSCSAIVMKADGKIMVAGWQTLAQLNSNGSRDASFRSPSLRADVYVRGVSLEPTGGITYTTSSPDINNGSNQVTTARLLANGAPDASFSAPTLNQSASNCLLRLADGRYLLGGIFRHNGSTSATMVRLLPSGALDVSLVSSPAGSAVGTTLAAGPVGLLAEQADGHILAAGNGFFAPSGGQVSIVRCESNGQTDNSFDGNYFYTAHSLPGLPNLTYNDARVRALLAEPDGGVVVAGRFEQVGGTPSYGLTRLLAAQRPLAMTPAAALPTVQLWPNPAREQIGLRFDGGTPPRQVALLDAVGRTVMSVAGAPALTLRTAELARGLYVLRLDYNGRTTTQRVVLD